MSEEELARQAGALMASDDASVDPRLEAYLRGDLSPAEREALETEAADDPSLAEAIALCAPLTPELRSQVVKRALESGRADRRPRRLLRLVVPTSILAAAAAAMMLISPPTKPLPDYQLVQQFGDAEHRGDDRPGHPVRDDSEMSIVLRPARVAGQAVAATLWVVTSSSAYPSPALAELSDDGGARWRGPAGALSGGRHGRIAFVAVIGRRDELPDSPPAAGAHPEGRWRSFSIQVDIRPEHEPP